MKIRRQVHMDFVILVYVFSCIPVYLTRDDAVDTFSNQSHVDDLHIAQVRFGGDVALHPRAERLAQEEAEDAKHQSNGQEQESPSGGARPLHRHPGHCRRKERCRNQIRSTTWVDRQSAFT